MKDRGEAIRIGVSGWTYPPWRGAFYPKDLRQKDELAYASAAFPAIEINGTFYSLQAPESFANWAAVTPKDFVFAVKGPRFVTHILRLKECETALANFFASGLLALGRKLGPVLWQVPPNMKFDSERLEAFLALLPHSAEAAAQLARRHDHRLKGPARLDASGVGRLRHALEIRHASFRTPEFVALLRRHDVALVCADSVKWPRLMDLTADFAYCRLHGAIELYRSRYNDAELRQWAARAKAWATGQAMRDGDFADEPIDDGKPRKVFMFFDNTDKLQAPGNARTLMDMLGVTPPV